VQLGAAGEAADAGAVPPPALRRDEIGCAVERADPLPASCASIMPSITGGNTNAPAMMIGERCAELMTSA
jgi:choline dehydrogenase-like flavoprotein